MRPALRLPFVAGCFDIVCLFNSLDHVDNVDQSVSEVTRVTRPGGALLLLVEVGHEPTPAEPHSVGWDVVEYFHGWELEWTARNGVRSDHSLYDSIEDQVPYAGGPGILRARLVRLTP